MDNMLSNDVRSPLARWLGGKSRMAKYIVPLIPEHTCYCEPFAGAAWILFKKPESRSEVLNDINKNIITLYRVIQNHLEEFVRYFKWLLVSRDEFERLKRVDGELLTDIQRAARFYYLHQCCFGGRMNEKPSFGYSSARQPAFNLLRIEENLSAAHLRLARTYIECLPFLEVIKRYDASHTVFYIDPPYWGCERYYGKGFFSREDFTKLRDQLKTIKGKFILSLNDKPEIRELFSDFLIQEIEALYTCSKGRNLNVGEVIIRNFE